MNHQSRTTATIYICPRSAQVNNVGSLDTCVLALLLMNLVYALDGKRCRNVDVHALCQTYQWRFGHSDWTKYGASTLLNMGKEDSTPLELERCGGVSRKGRRELSEQKKSECQGAPASACGCPAGHGVGKLRLHHHVLRPQHLPTATPISLRRQE